MAEPEPIGPLANRIVDRLRELAAAAEAAREAGAELPPIRAVIPELRRFARALRPLPAPAVPDVPKIIEAVALEFRIPVHEILSQTRRQRVAFARQVAMYLVREMTQLSFPAIARRFGRDHSTVIYSHALLARQLKDDNRMRVLLYQLRQKISQTDAKKKEAA